MEQMFALLRTEHDKFIQDHKNQTPDQKSKQDEGQDKGQDKGQDAGHHQISDEFAAA